MPRWRSRAAWPLPRPRSAPGSAMPRHWSRSHARPLAAEPRVRIDYVELRDADELTDITQVTSPAVLAMAAFLGATRLIDNRVLRP